MEENDHVYDVRELEGADLKEIVPFTSGDPYAIFLLESAGPVRKEIVRKAAQAVRREQRVGGQYHGKELTDLVFLCAGSGYREIRFFKFMLRGSRQPKLASFGWDERTVGTKRNNTVLKNNLPALRLEAEDSRPNWERARWARAWDTEPVTKAFYEAFETHRTAFLKHLPKEFATEKRHWMTSLTLNRLMFVWFLADGKRIPGLDREIVAALDQDDFYGGYFLPLCLCALGRRKGERGRWEAAFADVPYLNGGLFERHAIEEELGVTPDGEPGRTDFPAGLFRDLLSDPKDGDEGGLFRRFNWTLDEQGEEATSLSPHVLGYVFERHINGLDPEQEGQKKNGAYYTKEDITGYIARSTIIPRLFDKLDERKPGRASFNLAHLSNEGTMRYVFPSVKQAGLLPTETPYELKRRRARAEALRRANPTTADEFVTLNLNLSLLAEDFVSETRDPETLWAFYEGLREITVLDPTVGSGAFLLAALEVLAPIHRACLVRMEGIVREAADVVPVTNLAGAFHFEELAGQGTLVERTDSDAVARMRDEIEGIRAHGDPEAYVRKEIVLANLFGVDIMPEAVEICRLRLYLSLLGGGGGALEPLPDLEFNIVAGNALVGYPTIEGMNDLQVFISQTEGKLIEDRDRTSLKNDLAEFGRGLDAWRRAQLQGRVGGLTKRDLLNAAERIRPRLDRELYDLLMEVGMIQDELKVDERGRPARTAARTSIMVDASFETFRKRNNPFHWFLRLPQAAAGGGFDVIVGNPPWKEVSKAREEYVLAGFKTLSAGNLYALVAERSLTLLKKGGRLSLIVQLPLVCSERMKVARDLLQGSSDTIWASTYCDRPAKLFEGLENCRATIFMLRKGESQGELAPLWTTGYHRWSAPYRPHLIESVEYALAPKGFFLAAWPKIENEGLRRVFDKLIQLRSKGTLTQATSDQGEYPVFYQRSVQYYVKAFFGQPGYRYDGVSKAPANGRFVRYRTPDDGYAATAILCSTTFYCYYVATYDCFHMDEPLLKSFPASPELLRDPELVQLGRDLCKDFEDNAEWQTIKTAQGVQVEYQMFFARKSKPILDRIDCVLARHYGFTDEEYEFVRLYQDKFRSDRDADGADES